MRLRVNTPRVVHESIEGEIIALDFETGAYYSTSGVGALIWQLLSGGAESAALVREVQRRCPDGEPGRVQREVLEFVRELQREELIAVEDPGTGGPPSILAGELSSLPFATPVLEKYTDMQDLLLLDPIHEVDSDGWPKRK